MFASESANAEVPCKKFCFLLHLGLRLETSCKAPDHELSTFGRALRRAKPPGWARYSTTRRATAAMSALIAIPSDWAYRGLLSVMHDPGASTAVSALLLEELVSSWLCSTSSEGSRNSLGVRPFLKSSSAALLLPAPHQHSATSCGTSNFDHFNNVDV